MIRTNEQEREEIWRIAKRLKHDSTPTAAAAFLKWAEDADDAKELEIRIRTLQNEVPVVEAVHDAGTYTGRADQVLKFIYG
jgi:hypothetical protein